MVEEYKEDIRQVGILVISQLALITRVVCVFLGFDNFMGFAWAKSYFKHKIDKVINIYKIHISHIFGHTEAVNSENGSHSVNQNLHDYSQERG